MNFYNKYVLMCNRIGKTPSAVALEIGLSKPTVNRWKNGGMPTDATISKIAKYFGVSVSYMLGKEEKPTDKIVDELSPVKQELIARVIQMSEVDLEKIKKMLDILESK